MSPLNTSSSSSASSLAGSTTTNTSSSSSSSSSSGGGSSTSGSSSVQVVVRLRPLNHQEQHHGTLPVVKASTSEKTVTVLKGSGSRQQKTLYKFDNVFTAFSTQHDVFQATLEPVLKDVLMGYESTVFAYGQTGTGKTHTMEGNLNDPTREEFGVIPRSAAAIFKELETSPEYQSSTVSCSFLEIYNEELCDLLAAASTSSSSASSSKKQTSNKPNSNNKLTIMEGKNGPFCRGLSETKVENADELLELMRRAQQQRQTGETNMNKQSSRSHCIFTLQVHATRQLSDGSVLNVAGKLHCVDLAGSECAKSADLDPSSGNGGNGDQQAARERERMNINRSLLTLGRVVTMLKELSQNGGKSKNSSNVRIPYRDSKLTRILQESLGGRCKTCLIATVSPSVTAIEESLSTLNYAQAANGIVNKPVTSSSMSVVGTGMSSTGSGGKTSDGIVGGGGGAASVEHWQEMEVKLEYMQSQVDEAQQALARKHIQHQEFVDRAEKAESALKVVERNHQASLITIDELQKELKIVTDRAEMAEKALGETRVVLDATQRTEAALTKEATELLRHLKRAVADGDALHTKLLENRQDDICRRSATKESTTKQVQLLQGVGQDLETILNRQSKHRLTLVEQESENKKEELARLDKHLAIIQQLKVVCEDKILQLQHAVEDGIIPSFRSFADRILEGLNAAKDVSRQSNGDLLQDCTRLHDRLEANAIYLGNLETQYKSQIDVLLASIAHHLKESNESLDEIASNLAGSIESALSDRTKKTSDLAQSLHEWKHTCSSAVDGIESLTTSNILHLQEAVQSLSGQSNRHDAILEELARQAAFRQLQKDQQIKDLEEQKTRLMKQRDALVDSQRQQQKMNATFVANLMTKMKTFVQQEMDGITRFQNESHVALIKNTDALRDYNEAIQVTSNDTFEKLLTFGNKIKGDTETNAVEHKRDCASLSNTISLFSSTMEESLSDQQAKFDELAGKTLQTVQSMQTSDTASTDTIVGSLIEKMQTHGRETTTVIDDAVHNGTNKVNDLTDATWSFVKSNVIVETQNALRDEIEATGRQSTTKLESHLDGLGGALNEGKSSMDSETKNVLSIVTELKSGISTAVDENFNKSIERHKSNINASNWLQSMSNDHEKSVLATISKASSNVTSASETALDLSLNIIQVEQEIPLVADRMLPQYKTTLSSTPSDDVLLQRTDADIPIASENSELSLNTALSKSFGSTTAGIPVLKLRPVRSSANVRGQDDNNEGTDATTSSPGFFKRPAADGGPIDGVIEARTKRARRTQAK